MCYICGCFFFKQMTAYDMRISDWSSDVCSSDLDPIAELVRTVLSQNTNDRNRDTAYERLRERFPSWEQARDAPADEVQDAIRPGEIGRASWRERVCQCG